MWTKRRRGFGYPINKKKQIKYLVWNVFGVFFPLNHRCGWFGWNIPIFIRILFGRSKEPQLRDLAKSFIRVEVQNGQNTSFWFDVWSQRARLYDLTGSRGFIDLGIPREAIVASVLITHCTRNHRSEILNGIEEEIRKLH